jgi:hypothetical protein
MNASALLNRISALILLASLFLIVTCKKDDVNGPKYRVVEWNDYYNGVQDGKSLLSYAGDKISSISQYNYYSRGDSSVTEVEYPDDNSIVMTDYFKGNGSLMESHKQVMEIQDGQVTQLTTYSFHEGIWEPEYKLNLTMGGSGNLILEEILAFYYNEEWDPIVKKINEYDGSRLIQSIYYYYYEDEWFISFKEVIAYNGDNIVNIIDYEFLDGSYYENYKYDFQYDGKNMTRIDTYEYDSAAWNPGGYISFTYDQFENLESITDIDGYKTEYIYEEGKGNYRQIYFNSGGLLSNMYLPMPTKSKQCAKEMVKYLVRKKDF